MLLQDLCYSSLPIVPRFGSLWARRQSLLYQGASRFVTLYNGIYGLNSLIPWRQNLQTSVTIGNFDGCHLGHQRLLDDVITKARQFELDSVVVTFDPHPARFFYPTKRILQIQSLPDRLDELAGRGVSAAVVLTFDSEIAGLEPSAFVDKVLVSGLGAKFVVVGEDFRFGRGRSGSFETLKELGLDRGFDVQTLAPVLVDGHVVSSTRIKKIISESGDPVAVRNLLGHPWVISGIVEHGDKRGRQIGFPTANLGVGDLVLPPPGVYAGRVSVASNGAIPALPLAQQMLGVMNVGTRPTIEGTDLRVEVHILDVQGLNLYDSPIHVEIVSLLRQEQKFSSLEALKSQISLDCIRARELLG